MAVCTLCLLDPHDRCFRPHQLFSPCNECRHLHNPGVDVGVMPQTLRSSLPIRRATSRRSNVFRTCPFNPTFFPLFPPLESHWLRPLSCTCMCFENVTGVKRGHLMKICHDEQLIVAEQPTYMLIQAQTSPSSPALELFLSHSTARELQVIK